MRHIRLVVEYDGTELHGWQRQANGPTVQQHLEEALARLLTHEVAVTGASRTDAGVHARAQIASFRTERPIPLHGIRRGLNSMLPDAIAIREATEVDEAFHPRFSESGKHYRYTILTRPDRSPLLRHRAWHHPDPLDLTTDGDLVVVDVRGNAFLRNMVRIIVGTLVEVGTGRFTPAQVPEILESRDRTRAGITAPAQGLELVEVRYDSARVSSQLHTR